MDNLLDGVRVFPHGVTDRTVSTHREIAIMLGIKRQRVSFARRWRLAVLDIVVIAESAIALLTAGFFVAGWSIDLAFSDFMDERRYNPNTNKVEE